MKNVVLASLLVFAGSASYTAAIAQTPVSLGQQSTDKVQMSADEYAAYNNAVTQTTPAAKAAAYEAYLKAYPSSAVKADALVQLMLAYNASNDPTKTLDAADRVLAVTPTDFRALVFETLLNATMAANITDPAAKQAGLDKAAGYAEKGLTAPKPKDMSDADFKALQGQGFPLFYSAIGADDLQKKDNAGAEKAFLSELNAVPLAATTAPGTQLQDTYYLASAYYTSTPPDYLNCAYYAARAANYAPEPYKTNFNKLGQYCYTKFHGKPDGYDTTVTAVAAANLVPPATYVSSIAPAPKPSDYAAQVVSSTPDLAVLALSDKEFVLQYGKPDDAGKVFDSVKGKSVEIPGATIVSATADTLTVSVSDDAVQGKVADFTFNMKEPLKTVPAVGDKITLDGTYASYTQSPLMITMSDASVVEPKKAPAKKTPVHHTTHR